MTGFSTANLNTESVKSQMLGIKLSDRWYLDFLSKRHQTVSTPSLFGSFGLTGEGIHIYILSSGVRDLKFFKGRLHWLLGDEGVDMIGDGTTLALLAAGEFYGVAVKSQIFSLNVYDSNGVFDSALYQQAIHQIINHPRTNTGIVLTSIVKVPAFNQFIVDESLDYLIDQLIENKLLVVAPAGDGMRDYYTQEFKGPILASACHPNKNKDVITIGALSASAEISAFSNYGDQVIAFAPGQDIISVDSDGRFTIGQSTKISAALVAGILSFYVQQIPHITIAQIKEFIFEHFLHSSILTNYPLDCLQRDPFENDEYGHFSLQKSTGVPFNYLVNTHAVALSACTYFALSQIYLPSTTLGFILANTQFEISLGTKFRNLYNEDKDCVYTLLSVTPEDIGFFRLGEQSGILFGSVNNVAMGTVCTLSVKIEDGLHQWFGQFTLRIEPNYFETQAISGTIKARLPQVYGISTKKRQADAKLELLKKSKPHVQEIPVDRDVMIFAEQSTTELRLVNRIETAKRTGEFTLFVPLGRYKAVILNPADTTEAFVASL